ncbi:MAG TPA: hypothetical protein VGD84_04430 [Pseudonocardiaceae bacterium]
MIELKVGMRLSSAVCDTEIVLIRVPAGPVELTCGGQPMAADGTRGGTAPAGGGTQLGKRYVDVESGLEALCVRPGAGALAVDGRPLTIKAAQALPASD